MSLTQIALPDTGDNVAWARSVYPLTHSGRVCDLFQSNVLTPRQLLLEDVANAQVDGVLEAGISDTDPWGSAKLRGQLAARTTVPAERILLTTGCSNGLVVVCRAFLEPGSHVVVESPTYQPLARTPAMFGAEVTTVPRNPASGIDLDQLAAALRSTTRLVALTNLHNPTSSLASDDEVRAARDLAAQVGAVVVIDEVYGDLAAESPGRSGPGAVVAPGVISLCSLTKAYGLPMLSCGWILVPEEHRERVRRAWSDTELGTSDLLQAISTTVFDRFELYEDHRRQIADRNRAAGRQAHASLVAAGRTTNPFPAQGVTWFADLVGCEDSFAAAARLVQDQGVLVTPGEFYGVPGSVRVGLTRDPAEVAEGLDRLVSALTSW